MTKPANIPAIERATSKVWTDWVSELDALGGRSKTHAELARIVNNTLQGSVENHDWWAQEITVAYEQHIGKRIPGQLANGLFEIAVSKTAVSSRDALFTHVVKWFEGKADLRKHEPLKPRSTETPKRSNWRCDFIDGSKFAATVEVIDEKRSKLVLSHTAIPTKSDAEAWKVFWASVAVELLQ